MEDLSSGTFLVLDCSKGLFERLVRWVYRGYIQGTAPHSATVGS